jgi:anaerobic magnesium-protoporphyrin IX monomethyl ester cyclase
VEQLDNSGAVAGLTHCRTLMFGIESGSQRVLDQLKKEQTLEEVERAVNHAKQAGIEIVHGFFTVGNPHETVADMRATFDFAARLKIDTFNFNRLCVYRGTLLWQEYIRRNLVDDAKDRFKYFKCSKIDPTCLSGEVINRDRRSGLRRLFIHRPLHRPLQTILLLHRFTLFMRLPDMAYLIVKPFFGKRCGATKAEALSRAVEHAELKDAAGALTQVADAMLEQAVAESDAKRA